MEKEYPIVANIMGSIFRDKAEGYNCTLEQRQASGGLGNRTAVDTEKKYTQPLGLGRTGNDCAYQ